MVWCQSPSELNTNVILTLHYYGYKYYNVSGDTNQKVIIYTIPNNVNSIHGVVQISSSLSYTNEGINHNQPAVETYSNGISYGFIESNYVFLNSTNSKFNADTMEINFNIQPAVGNSYPLLCKYKKI